MPDKKLLAKEISRHMEQINSILKDIQVLQRDNPNDYNLRHAETAMIDAESAMQRGIFFLDRRENIVSVKRRENEEMPCEICGKSTPKGMDLEDLVEIGWSFFTIGNPKRYDAAICPDHTPKEAVQIVCRDILGWKSICRG